MFGSRRGLGLLSIGLGVLALVVIMRGGMGRRGGGPDRGGRQHAVLQPAAAAPQAPASNASPDYLRGYADGLEARQQNAQPVAPQSIRQVRGGGHDRHGGFGWMGLLALPFLILGGLLLLRNQGWRWNRGWGRPGRRPPGRFDRDHDRPLPARPEAEKPPYTGETHRF
jgi:hypothetical protein